MEDHDLPAELRKLQQQLAARPRGEPSVGFRSRVLDRVRRELGRNGACSRWQFAAGIAAALLVWINLSHSATHDTDCGLRFGTHAGRAVAVAEQIRQLLPDISPRDAYRQAIVLQSGSTLAWCPEPQAHRGARARLGELLSPARPMHEGRPAGARLLGKKRQTPED